MRKAFILMTMLVAAVVAFGGARLYFDRQMDDGGSGKALIGGPFTLIDQDGKTATEGSYAGRLLFVYFGYTFCPDVCPTELQNMTLALDELTARERAKLQPLFISFDPERDTPPVLKEYLQNFHADFRGLTGSQEQVNAALKTYRVYAAKAKETTGSGDYLMDHSAYVYLMDGKGEYIMHFRPQQKAEDIAKAIRARL